jgi:hypothetical protein
LDERRFGAIAHPLAGEQLTTYKRKQCRRECELTGEGEVAARARQRDGRSGV